MLILIYQYLPTESVDREFVDIDGGLWALPLASMNRQAQNVSVAAARVTIVKDIKKRTS